MLSSTATKFFVERFGSTPEPLLITNPDGSTDTAYLIEGRNGFEPWPIKRVEAYAAWMTSTIDEQVEILKKVEAVK